MYEQPEPEKVLARRVDQFVDEFGFERQGIVGWAFGHAVLSISWSVEDNDTVSEWELAYAEMLARLFE
jgi:streptomycin 6-kinase